MAKLTGYGTADAAKEGRYGDRGELIPGAAKFRFLADGRGNLYTSPAKKALEAKLPEAEKLAESLPEGKGLTPPAGENDPAFILKELHRKPMQKTVADTLETRELFETWNKEIEALATAGDYGKFLDRLCGWSGDLARAGKMLFKYRLRRSDFSASGENYLNYLRTPEERAEHRARKELVLVETTYVFAGSRSMRYEGKIDGFQGTFRGKCSRAAAEYEKLRNLSKGDLMIWDHKKSWTLVEAGCGRDRYEDEVAKRKAEYLNKKRKQPPTVKCGALADEEVKRILEGEDIGFPVRCDSDKLYSTYGFRGLQVGNSIKKADREISKVISRAFVSLNDFARSLGIRITDVSMGGTLGLALAARGKGGSRPAAATFEGYFNVINLTRRTGAGSYAHELGHALDYYIGTVFGNGEGFATSFPECFEAAGDIAALLKDGNSLYLRDAEALDAYENRRKAYWADTAEMFARAFSSYVIDKLSQNGLENNFLAWEYPVSGPEGEGRIPSPHPQGEDRKHLDEAFDRLIESLKKEGVFGEYDGAGFDLPAWKTAKARPAAGHQRRKRKTAPAAKPVSGGAGGQMAWF